VWLSEVMLQQTTVTTVVPRFERFIARWPSIDALAAASDEDVLSEWAGLGYYARARNLIACAREVAKRGGFPGKSEELRSLPGIGAYTSAAIAAIAFGERAAAVDTNVKRVMARLCGLKHPSRREIDQLLLAMMPPDRPGDFVQAMMDLGASICRPNKPACAACPLQEVCAGFKTGNPEATPARKQRRLRSQRYGLAYWIEHNRHVWLVRRPASGLLGGMAALPGTEWTDVRPATVEALGSVRHVFTHFSLDLQLVAGADVQGEGWWQPIDQIAQAGLPTLYRRAAELVLSLEKRLAA
jgi:A/G-specific adenine glycosylase